MQDRIVDTDGIKRRELNILFVIDNSGSMSGEKIGAVNNAIRDVIKIMPEIQNDTADVDIKISALTFSDSVNWVSKEPKLATDFVWRDVSTNGQTNYSKAYDELANFLTRRSNGGQMPDLGGVAPIIILMSDGLPTSEDWKQHLDSLKKKGWFNVALKYALAIQVDTDEANYVLKSFTGDSNTVLKVYTAEALRKVIRVIAVTASKVKSSSSHMKNGQTLSTNEMAEQEINKGLEEIENVEW